MFSASTYRMDSDGAIKVLLGGAHLDGHAKALGHLAHAFT